MTFLIPYICFFAEFHVLDIKKKNQIIKKDMLYRKKQQLIMGLFVKQVYYY